jgi:hypothetical protein
MHHDHDHRTSLITIVACQQEGYVECTGLLLLNAGAALDLAKEGSAAPQWRYAAVDWPQENGATPLYTACRYGKVECTRLLLEVGAAVDQADESGGTPLITACYNKKVECTRLLLEAGASVYLADENGVSPLWIACHQGDVECTRLLLEAGAAVDQADDNGITPLWIACLHNCLECTRLLLEAGAAMGQADEAGDTPLAVACIYGHLEVAQLLSSYGSNRQEDLVDLTRRENNNDSDSEGSGLADWLQLSAGWTPLHHLETLTAQRATALLRSGTNCPHAIPEADAAGPTPLTRAYELQQEGQAPKGSAAALLIAATGSWSPETHHLFPAPARACARAAMCVGFCLAHRWNDMGLYHVWRDIVMPWGIERTAPSAKAS